MILWVPARSQSGFSWAVPTCGTCAPWLFPTGSLPTNGSKSDGSFWVSTGQIRHSENPVKLLQVLLSRFHRNYFKWRQFMTINSNSALHACSLEVCSCEDTQASSQSLPFPSQTRCGQETQKLGKETHEFCTLLYGFWNLLVTGKMDAGHSAPKAETLFQLNEMQSSKTASTNTQSKACLWHKAHTKPFCVFHPLDQPPSLKLSIWYIL